jgi:Family of unknown function (DUF6152)
MNDLTMKLIKPLTLIFCGLTICIPAFAHHGSAISYDTRHLWTTWVTVTEFNYLNPHPSMTFDRATKDGKTEHWVSELGTNPSMLVRAGWTKSRSVEALKPGTKVKLYIATSRAGGFSAIVLKLEDEKGENIVGEAPPNIKAVDMDGVPGGLQPTGDDKLPGKE